jgi:NAD(P)H-flavin reductase
MMITAPQKVREPMRPRPFRVIDKERDTHDTVTQILEPLDGEPFFFLPGQFMMFYTVGVGEVPASIAGNPQDTRRIVHTVRGQGAVTDSICDLDIGDVVGLRGPYGTGWPMDDAVGKDLLIITGGIGLAPLRPAVLEGLRRRSQLSSLSLLYGARTPRDLLFKDDLLGWESSPDVNVEITVDRAGVYDWSGDVGLVTTLLPRIYFTPENTQVFICGPEVMMRVVARELRDRGVPSSRIWISLERNMKCAIGFCGHCQFGPGFLCKEGPVVPFDRFEQRMTVSEL